jgi:hypothetical protein
MNQQTRLAACTIRLTGLAKKISLLACLILFCRNTACADGVSPADWQTMTRKLAALPAAQLPLPTAEHDWLLQSDWAKAGVFRSTDGKSLIITNGLVARIFRLTPNLATTDIVNQMTGENMLRAVSGEGQLVIDGKPWDLGGLQGQPERGYIKPEWVDGMTATPQSFTLTDFDVTDHVDVLPWARSRWALNKADPTGRCVTFTLRGNGATRGIVVRLRYDIYDHVPVIRKSFEITNGGDSTVTLNTFRLEHLFFAEPESTEGDQHQRYLPSLHVESDFACGGSFWAYTADRTTHWTTDPQYTSQCNYGNRTLCTLDVNLQKGPEAEIASDSAFTSYHVYEMPFDTYGRERQGLFLRHFYATVAPWTTENPIFMHLTSTDPDVVRRAVDQCAATGYEMIILSFGSGMNAETTSESHIAHIKALVDYARSKGIEMGGYSLLASRSVGPDVDVIDSLTGKPGGATFGSSPCLCSQWGVDYLARLKRFIERTGLTLLEHDGSYPGDWCASTSHPYHKGLLDSQWKQFRRITDFYHWALRTGVSLNVPDFYFLNGSTKVSIGYKEGNWSLPRDRQLIHGRQVNFSGTFDRTASMCWTFVPLVQYQGGGAAATIEPLDEHLATYKAIMMQNYGAGVQACYRGPRLYDTERTKAAVQEVVGWYKRYRNILNSDIIHLRRADGRDWDGFLHVSATGRERGLLMLFNPTATDIVRTIKVPLYYTGLTHRATVRQEEGHSTHYTLGRDYSITLTATIPANGCTWYVIEP